MSANSEARFDSTSQVDTHAFYADPRQQDWPHEAATQYFNPNELGTFAQVSPDAQCHFPITELQNRYNEPTTYNGMPDGSDFIWEDSTSQPLFAQVVKEDMSFNPVQTSEEDNFSGKNWFSTQPSSFNGNSQFPISAYNTSNPLQQIFTHPSISPPFAETYFSSQSAISSSSSSISSPADPPSPNSTRFPCSYPTCDSTFKLPGDMKRHARRHDPARNQKYYHCWAAGSNRNGWKCSLGWIS